MGVDGSPASEAAVAFAFDAAASRGVPLVAVHTWWDLLVDATMAPLIDWDAVEADEREVLAERLAGWKERYPDVAVRRLVTRDRPARALVRESGRALVHPTTATDLLTLAVRPDRPGAPSSRRPLLDAPVPGAISAEVLTVARSKSDVAGRPLRTWEITGFQLADSAEPP